MTDAPTTVRHDGRQVDELRPISFERDFTEFAAGSVLVTFGRTKVLKGVDLAIHPKDWMKGKGEGWVTAEYSMLPGSTDDRVRREVKEGRPSGRPQEIQRLIGRCPRPRGAPAPPRSAAGTSHSTTP